MDDIIDQYDKGIDLNLQALDKKIYDALIDYMVGSLSVSDDVVKYTQGNISAIQKIESVLQSVDPTLNKLGTYILKGISEVVESTEDQMTNFNKELKNKTRAAKGKIKNHAATSVNQILELQPIFAEIKRNILSLISKPGGVSLVDIRKDLKNRVIFREISKRYFARWTHDVLAQYQRAASNEFRKMLGLQYAIYQGGLIETSRKFCIERNRKVFHIDEILKWEKLEWEGKPETGYDPIIDLGGYNCRHRLGWISDQLAKQLLKRQNVKVEGEEKTFPNIQLNNPDKLPTKTVRDVLKAVGLPGNYGGQVNLRNRETNIKVDITGNGINQKRILFKDKESINNSYFKFEKGKGTNTEGFKIFYDQITEAAKQGYKKIVVQAVGEKGSDYNGYYTWLRFGFRFANESLRQRALDHIYQKTGMRFKHEHEMMSTKLGAAAWKEHGFDWYGEFDLTPGSPDMLMMDSYYKERINRK